MVLGGPRFAKSLAIAYTQKQTQQSNEQIDSNRPVYTNTA